MFNVKILDPKATIPGKCTDFLRNIQKKNERVNFFARSCKDFASFVNDGMKVSVSSQEIISVSHPAESDQHLLSDHDEADT